MQMDKRSLELYLHTRERQTGPASRRWVNRGGAAAAAGLAVALLGFAVWYVRTSSTGAAAEPRVLASIAGRPALPSASADGRTILFSASADGSTWEVYTAAAGQMQATQLTHDAQRKYSAVVRPDGRSFAYITRDDPLSIGIRPLEPDAPPRILATMEGLRRIAWHPNGEWIFASVEGPFAGLFAVSLETAVWRRLTSPVAPHVDGDLAVSPDGRYLAFTRGESPTRGRLLVAPLSADNALAGEPVTLVDTPHAASPAWSRDGKAIYFTLEAELRRAYPARPGVMDRVEAGDAPVAEIFATTQGLLLATQRVPRQLGEIVLAPGLR